MLEYYLTNRRMTASLRSKFVLGKNIDAGAIVEGFVLQAVSVADGLLLLKLFDLQGLVAAAIYRLTTVAVVAVVAFSSDDVAKTKFDRRSTTQRAESRFETSADVERWQNHHRRCLDHFLFRCRSMMTSYNEAFRLPEQQLTWKLSINFVGVFVDDMFRLRMRSL